jgi:hypothetical protein
MRGFLGDPPAASASELQGGEGARARAPASRYAVRGPHPWDRTRSQAARLGGGFVL